LVERPLNVGMLGSLSHRSKVLVLSAQLRNLGRERVVGRTLGKIEELGAVIFNVLLRQHESILILRSATPPSRSATEWLQRGRWADTTASKRP
jgi:hypothetical protein